MADDKKKEIDKHSGVETTGHEWDGIKELNNPMPRWWLWTFYVCIIWSVGYWFVYPAWPTLSGNTKGAAEWTQYKKLAEEQQEIVVRRGQYLQDFKKASFDEILNNQGLYEFAIAGGKAAFKDNCATCHGSGGAGAAGYPNLNDDDWIWGGSLSEIYKTLEYGIRSGHDEARISEMPAFGELGILDKKQIGDVANYILVMGKQGKYPDGADKIYADNCASCHGVDGKGGREFGAPNLVDSVWLYGGKYEDILTQLHKSKHGKMPSWSNRLDEQTIRQLSIYVHSLGGGEAEQQVIQPAEIKE